MPRFSALASACVGLALASACSFPEKLERPAIYWQFGDMPCHDSLALDAEGQLWLERGCENGRQPMRRLARVNPEQRAVIEAVVAELPPGSGVLSQDQFERLRAAFAELREFPPYTTCPESYELTLYDPSGCRRYWLTPRCEDETRAMERIDDEPGWADNRPLCPAP